MKYLTIAVILLLTLAVSYSILKGIVVGLLFQGGLIVGGLALVSLFVWFSFFKGKKATP